MHTLRVIHPLITDLARSDWDLHQIAQFAGHRKPAFGEVNLVVC